MSKKKTVKPRNPVAFALSLRGKGKPMGDRRKKRLNDREARELREEMRDV